MEKVAYSRPRKQSSVDSDEVDSYDMVRSACLPVLYILTICTGIVGCACNGIITRYWAESIGRCYLYAATASNSIIYQFGSVIHNCHFVTYGGVTALFLCAIAFGVYFFMVRGDEKTGREMLILLVLVTLSSLFFLTVSCVLTEGMRQTCAAMGLNSANNKGEGCMDKLDIRVSQYNLPIETSVMVTGATGGLWGATVFILIITVLHFYSFYKHGAN
ncbi:unnamed protein product [Meganyctiphanes norvegica]|uniref:MARVEL domain-containing protein n=1 Tax=Meganyctiphanes norvegica TaxID=48144 RepID=A0AAV2SAU3_MEGNR